MRPEQSKFAGALELDPSCVEKLPVFFSLWREFRSGAIDAESALYRWVEAMGQRRVTVLRSAITRIGASDQVNAEFEIAEAP